jgi:hypothetical protein
MKKAVNTIVIVVVNILLSGLMTFACVITSFQLGWADTGDHTLDTWLLYCGFIILHLIANLLLITRPKKNKPLFVVATCVFIIALYGLIWVCFKAEVFGYYDG